MCASVGAAVPRREPTDPHVVLMEQGVRPELCEPHERHGAADGAELERLAAETAAALDEGS